MAAFDILHKAILDPIFGNSKTQDQASQDALNNALAQFTAIKQPELSAPNLRSETASSYTPTLQQGSDILQNYGNVDYSKIDPSLYSALTQDQSAMNGISLDPQYKSAQTEALGGLQDIIANGGLNAQDQANLQAIQNSVNASAKGRSGAIQQAMESRGMGGGGLDLLAQLQNAQDASSNANTQSMDVASQAQARQLQALLNSGSMAQNMAGQQFGQQADIAKANDIINQFNTQNRNQMGLVNSAAQNQTAALNAANQYQSDSANRQNANNTAQYNINNANQVNQSNAAAKNQAAQYNAGNQQQANTANTNTYNQGAMYNANIPQQQFNNQMQQAAGASNQYGNLASDYQRQATQKNQEISDYLNGAFHIGASLANKGDKSQQK